ncbi:hypothetical protein [Aneurinibacillus tyrosinisolvens]|uniref:hypothetical protein n=1 Tax=Aneurinibacillus tyrosinisolvens TaxID=1443435 RepID=UPI00063F12BE|nr:hypothetical protein [Aneurinibacillus tyrosinisolvens]
MEPHDENMWFLIQEVQQLKQQVSDIEKRLNQETTYLRSKLMKTQLYEYENKVTRLIDRAAKQTHYRKED